ncbi:MAG: DUF5686 and carboxypeptidase regulatory-like domain-containing protein [Chitinophagaceae bacterium]
MFRLLKIFFCSFFLFIAEKSLAQQLILEGVVTNSKLEPLAFATVQIKGNQIGTRTDESGYFKFKLYENEYELVISLLGYETKKVKLILDKTTKLQHILLLENKKSLNEIKITSSKKDNAEDIIRNVIENKSNKLHAIKSYAVDLYIKASEEKNKQKKKDSIENKMNSLSEILLHVDYQYPNKIKETRNAVKNRGEKETLFYLTTTDGDFNLYENLLQVPSVSEMPFLSPISYSGLIAYKYKTLQIIKKNNYKIYTIRFSPSRMGNSLLDGQLSIIDTSWAILEAEYNLPSYHMPEYKTFSVHQEYDFVQHKAWMLVDQSFSYTTYGNKTKASGKTIVNYDNYILDTVFNKKYFNNELSTTTISAYEKDSSFWNTTRKIPLTENEIKYIQYTDSTYKATHSKAYFDSVDKQYNKIQWQEVLFTGPGFYNREKDISWNIYPALGTVRLLLPGGTRIAYGGDLSKTQKNKKKYIISADISYGLKNKDFLGNVRTYYRYNPFSQGYVRNNIGKNFEFIFSGDSYVNLFRRNNFYLNKKIESEHGVELFNGFNIINKIEFSRREPLTYLKLTYQYDSLFNDSPFFTKPIDFEPYNAFYFTTTFEYTPFQKYLREPYEKTILGSKYPTAYLTWRKGVPGLFNSKINFDYVEFGLYQKIKLGLAGISNYRLYSGMFHNQKKLEYIDYKFISRGNPYLFNNPLLSFQLLDSTFPIFKRFYEGHFKHDFNGAIINKIPIIKKINILEVAGAGMLYIPSSNVKYIEAYAGLEKIVHIFNEQIKFGVYVVSSLSNQQTKPIQIKFGLDFYDKHKNTWH